MLGHNEILHGCFRVKRRKPSRPGFKAGPHAHMDTTNKCLHQNTSASDAEDNKWYSVDITAVLADCALSSRCRLQNISALGLQMFLVPPNLSVHVPSYTVSQITMSISGQGFQTSALSNTSFHCSLVGRDHKSKRLIPVLALLKLEKHFGTRTDRLQEVQHVTHSAWNSLLASPTCRKREGRKTGFASPWLQR